MSKSARSRAVTAALLFGGLWFGALSGHAENLPEVFRYKNRQGRTVFVDRLDRVPAEFRQQAQRVDLSDAPHNRLHFAQPPAGRPAGDSRCGRSVSPSSSRWQLIWQRHGHWVLIGAVGLLLLVASPWIGGLAGPAGWARTLSWLLPLLLVTGVAGHLAWRGRAIFGDQATACAQRPKTAAPNQRPTLRGLKKDLSKAQQRRAGQIDRALSQPRAPAKSATGWVGAGAD
ncbi:MAG: hypothetical protein H6707_12990 [Deltaproteobacteria bacterium]|nr:hypothetical protein [Deltaproteobacteria bacterium]